MKSNNEIRLENLENLINEAGSQEKLADVSGVSRIYLNQIKKQRPDPTTGKTRNVGDAVARKLETGMGKPMGWLDQVHTLREPSVEYNASGYIQLPYLEIESSAGRGKHAVDHPPILQYLNVLEEWAFETFGKNAKDYIKLINNTGDSMAPTIQDGDILFVDTSKRYYEADGIYILNWQDRLLTKRLVAQQDGRLAIKSDNKIYDSEYVNESTANDLAICGLVKAWWTLKKY